MLASLQLEYTGRHFNQICGRMPEGLAQPPSHHDQDNLKAALFFRNNRICHLRSHGFFILREKAVSQMWQMNLFFKIYQDCTQENFDFYQGLVESFPKRKAFLLVTHDITSLTVPYKEIREYPTKINANEVQGL